MAEALALKYRPHKFSDLTEQSAVVKILENQIATDTIKHGYLFVGAAGTGKTTSARIFADMINKSFGEPIELDAASNNSVDDIRRITEEAQTKSLDSEYKVFIIDECHMLSNSAWNAFLKTLEEPPAKSIFILCTTNPEKIPATILSRVQRYNFQRISMQGVINRLLYILEQENKDICSEGSQDAVNDIEWAKKEGLNVIDWDIQAVDLIAKIADGGMRDAITLLDKCLSYCNNLTVQNVINALGVADYDTMFELTAFLSERNIAGMLNLITGVYESGMDLKQFIKDYFEFILDLNTYKHTGSMDSIKLPINYETTLKETTSYEWQCIISLLQILVDLMNEIKWVQNPKSIIIARFMLYMQEV